MCELYLEYYVCLMAGHVPEVSVETYIIYHIWNVRVSPHTSLEQACSTHSCCPVHSTDLEKHFGGRKRLHSHVMMPPKERIVCTAQTYISHFLTYQFLMKSGSECEVHGEFDNLAICTKLTVLFWTWLVWTLEKLHRQPMLSYCFEIHIQSRSTFKAYRD